MNSFKILILVFSLILTINIKHSELCSSLIKFPENGVIGKAIMKGSFNGSVIEGSVTLTQASLFSNLLIHVQLSGLPAGRGELNHGLHVHEFGINSTSENVTIKCGSTGSHYNPLNKTHGNINSTMRHMGDYGNIKSDNDGNVDVKFTDTLSKLYGAYGIIGRAIVLHLNPDDVGLGGNPASLITGNSGARIACGVIGLL